MGNHPKKQVQKKEPQTIVMSAEEYNEIQDDRTRLKLEAASWFEDIEKLDRMLAEANNKLEETHTDRETRITQAKELRLKDDKIEDLLKKLMISEAELRVTIEDQKELKAENVLHLQVRSNISAQLDILIEGERSIKFDPDDGCSNEKMSDLGRQLIMVREEARVTSWKGVK